MNPALYDAVEKAKKANVPADNIERAIKRGSGADKDAAEIHEIIYEGYAPGGVAVIVKALTDNRNRTAPNIRHIFSQYGGSLGETGSVSSFAFHHQGYIVGICGTIPRDLIEEYIIESGASDYEFSDDGATVRIATERTALMGVVRFLREKKVGIESYGLEYVATNMIEVTDFDKVLKIYKLLADLEDDDDVEQVWNNAEISPELWHQAEELVEKSQFRT